MISRSGQPLGKLIGDRIERFPASGEINRRVENADAALEAIERAYASGAVKVDHTDGVGIDFEDWRFNLRKSNTEPLIRLNVETRGDIDLMRRRTDEILALMK